MDENKVYLIGDIGGTHISLGIAHISNSKYEIIVKEKYLTGNFNDICEVTKEFLDQIKNTNSNLKIDASVIGIATKIPENFDMTFHLSNSPFAINKDEFAELIGTQDTIFINDFESLGWEMTKISKDKLELIKQGKSKSIFALGVQKETEIENLKKPNLTIVGAGTGLGKITMRYDTNLKKYFDIPSEAGHDNFNPLNEDEVRLCNLVKKKIGTEIIEFEDILSGNGIENIYYALSKNEDITAKQISSLKKTDITAKQTFELFYKFYARFAREMALKDDADIVFLVGGIIEKNLDFSKENFIVEFLNSSKKEKLEKISIYAVNDYDISLEGVCEYIINNS